MAKLKQWRSLKIRLRHSLFFKKFSTRQHIPMMQFFYYRTLLGAVKSYAQNSLQTPAE